MSRIALPIAVALTLSLSACATVPPARTGGPLPPSVMQCDASGVGWAIGQSPTADIIERVRIDTHSRIARVLRPGQVVTMEFSAERVNLNVNEREAITGITCG
ncbi:MAG: I78 family peptidase inhibitor [Luteimonas sp.]